MEVANGVTNIKYHFKTTKSAASLPVDRIKVSISKELVSNAKEIIAHLTTERLVPEEAVSKEKLLLVSVSVVVKINKCVVEKVVLSVLSI